MKTHAGQIFGFLVVGTLSAGIDAGLFVTLVVSGLNPVVASVFSFLSAFIVNYGGNRTMVFRARNTPGAFWRYVALVAINLILSAGIVALAIGSGMHPVAAKVVSMAVIAVVNFLAMRNWVFRDRANSMLRTDDRSES